MISRLIIIFTWFISNAFSGENVLKVSMEEAIRIGTENHQKLTISESLRQAAESRHRQALAAYWPQITATISYTHLDQQPESVVPASEILLPDLQINTPPQQFNVDTPSPFPGIPGQSVPVNVPSQSLAISPGTISIPQQSYTLYGRDQLRGSVGLEWLIADGGERRATTRAAKAIVRSHSARIRSTSLDVEHDIKKYYNAVALGQQLEAITDDALASLRLVTTITETLVESGLVLRTEHLRARLLLEQARSRAKAVRENRQLSELALGAAIGLSHGRRASTKTKRIDYQEWQPELSRQIELAYQSNPDWLALDAEVESSIHNISRARAGARPKLAVFGNLEGYEDGQDHGLSTKNNNRSWNVGVGVSIPIFEGGLHRNRTREAKAQSTAASAKRRLIKDATASEIHQNILHLKRMQADATELSGVLELADEHVSLCLSGLRENMIESKEVTEAVLIEAISKAKHQIAKYHATIARYRIERLTGAGEQGKSK